MTPEEEFLKQNDQQAQKLTAVKVLEALECSVVRHFQMLHSAMACGPLSLSLVFALPSVFGLETTIWVLLLESKRFATLATEDFRSFALSDFATEMPLLKLSLYFYYNQFAQN